MTVDYRRRSSRYAAALVVLLALSLVTSPAGARGVIAAVPAHPSVPARSAMPRQVTETLITGDVVTYTATADGRHSVGLRSGAGSGSSSVQVYGDGAHLYAIPSSVAADFWNGALDRELFDVKYLADNGYGDSKTATLPVILQYQKAASPSTVSREAQALPGSDVTAALPSVHGAGVRVHKSQARAFWRSIIGPASASASAAPGQAPPAQSAPKLADGLQKVWLDRRVRVSDDVSGPQIGAPIAWAAGFDGTGVKVAVLDTGIDLTHPDLQGKVAESKVFTGEPSVQDGFGHGTHVASIIAGSGAASGGQYKGVAPGAQLVVGKVLDNSGSGSDSEIIAGMQWAASSGAKVVNMSLGSSPTDGTDPVSEAVDDLTASTGTLFVIAAGNSGPGAETVDAPGAADAALTVAAVDRNDQLAGFSSRGPRFGDAALKPDIAAPGVNIVAARATGTNIGPPVGTEYTSLSGTSMATPHVAASAAILAEEHSDWSAGQLKAALMSSAKDDGDSPYGQGSGRVDIGQAVSQQVFAATDNLDYGALPFPQNGPPISKTLTYTNGSGQPVTLNLDAILRNPDGSPAPAGMLSLPASTVTVPAGGSADVTVVLDASLGGTGNFAGAIHATAAGVRLTTPVVASKGAQSFALTLRTLGRDGRPANLGFVSVDGIDHPEISLAFLAGASAVVHVPAGTYSITSSAVTTPGEVWTDTFQLDPQFDLTQDAELVFDARKTVEERIDPPQASYLHNTVYATRRVLPDGSERVSGTATGNSFTPQQFFVSPTQQVTWGALRYDFFQAYGPEPVTMRTVGDSHLTLDPKYALGYATAPAFHGRQIMPIVDVGQATPADLAGRDLHGKLALVLSTDPLCIEDQTLQAIATLGAAGVVAYHSKFAYMGGQCTLSTIPVVGITHDEGAALAQRLARHPVSVAVDGTGADPSYVYNLDLPVRGRIPTTMIWHARSRDVGAVDVRAHAAQPTQYADAPFTYQPDEDFSVRVVFLMNVPHVVREYFGPVSPDTVWQRDSVNGVLSLADETLSIFAKPGVQTQDVDDGPFVPGAVLRPDVHAVQPRFVSLCSGCREGDTYTPLFNTTTGTPADVLPLQQQAEIHLYQNGQELPSAGDPVFGVLPSFTLTPGPASYRLTQQYDVEDGLAQPQRVLTSWTYTSAGTSGSGQTPPGYYCLLQAAANDFTLPCRAEPQVLLRYQLGLGLDNRLPAPGASAISVTAYHQPAAGTVPPIRGLHLAFTVDGGAHWQNVHTVSRGDGQFAATLILPKLGQTTGLVGLRAEAWDSAGNRVVQTISNAFGLAGQ